MSKKEYGLKILTNIYMHWSKWKTLKKISKKNSQHCFSPQMFWRLITGNEKAEEVQGRDKWHRRFFFVPSESEMLYLFFGWLYHLWHCSQKGPYLGTWVPIGTFLTFWVPIYISGSLLSMFWLNSREEHSLASHHPPWSWALPNFRWASNSPPVISLSILSLLSLLLPALSPPVWALGPTSSRPDLLS